MSAAVVISPTSGNITHASTVCEITATGLASNDTASYDNTKYPSEPAFKYVFEATLAGQSDLVSPVFTSSSGGTAEWHGVIFPAAGTWTLAIEDAADDSTKATASVIVA